MCLFDGQNFGDRDCFFGDRIECREMVADMKPVYLFLVFSFWCFYEFFIPSLTGIGIFSQRGKPRADDPPALVIKSVEEIKAPAPDDDFKAHSLISESGTKSSSSMIRWVCSYSLRRFSSRTSSLMTSSKVWPGLRRPWTASHVLGQTGILFVAHSWSGIPNL